MEFIGRKSELTRIGRALAKDGQANALVYGRRRVGKSALIKRALDLAPQAVAIYFECRQTSEQDNVHSLAAPASESLGFPPLALGGMGELLDFLFKQAREKSIVPVLDEYPYLRDAVKGLDSIPQTAIDRNRKTSGLKIILCGSYVEVMKSLLESSNPLYGRVDLLLELKPMDYFDAAKFYPAFSPEDKVRL